MYGVVKNTQMGGLRQTFGTLTCEFRPLSGGSPVVSSTSLTNINDQFSYILVVPCETQIAGFPVSSNTLRLGTAYGRGEILLDGTNVCTFAEPSLTNLALSATDRGLVQRIDLDVAFACEDEDPLPNGLPDCWERAFFGQTGQDANDDPDADGLANLAEYKAGTDPLDPTSRFAFINIQSLPEGGALIQWSSVTKHYYSIQRSGNLTLGFTNLVIGIAATPSLNSYTDATATGPGPYFYRIRSDQ